MAFRFNECSMRALAAFAEDYRVEVTPGGCRLSWALGKKSVGPSRWVMFVTKPEINLGYRRFLANLRRCTYNRFGRSVQTLPRRTPDRVWVVDRDIAG